jgi:hypothetical protein
MKTHILILIFTALLATTLNAQQTVTVNASNYDISDNLDLRAVAYLFGESKDLEEFERKLNDPELEISNLDLNLDGYIDYLRVVEVKQGKVFVITIQAVLDRDLFQDVATIDVQVKNKKTVNVQIVGNEYIYGANYIIEPVFVHRPVIYDFFWYPRRVVWVSPWYYSYYPVYYHQRPPRTVYVYHNHVHNYYHPRVHCYYAPKRNIHTAVVIHKNVQRNDWAKSKPEQTFSARNNGVENHRQLTERRSTRPSASPTGTATKSVETNTRRAEPANNAPTQVRRSSTATNSRSEVPSNQTKSQSVTVETGLRNNRTAAPTEARRSSNVEARIPATRNTSAEAPNKSQSVNAPVQRQAPAATRTSATVEYKAPANRGNSPAVATQRQNPAPSTRNEVKSTPAPRSETRQQAAAQRQSQPANVRSAAPQNKSATVAKPASNEKSKAAPASSSSNRKAEKSDQKSTTSSRR